MKVKLCDLEDYSFEEKRQLSLFLSDFLGDGKPPSVIAFKLKISQDTLTRKVLPFWEDKKIIKRLYNSRGKCFVKRDNTFVDQIEL